MRCRGERGHFCPRRGHIGWIKTVSTAVPIVKAMVAAVVGTVPPGMMTLVGAATDRPPSRIVTVAMVPPELVVPTMFTGRGLNAVSSIAGLPTAEVEVTYWPPALVIAAKFVAFPQPAPPAAMEVEATVCKQST